LYKTTKKFLSLPKFSRQETNKTINNLILLILSISQSRSDIIFDDYHSENTSIITTSHDNSSRSINNNNNNNRNRTNNKNRRKRFTSQNEGGDRLAGMMTDKEKNWVINVQMLQLHINDPYRQDYYYTVCIMLFFTLFKLTVLVFFFTSGFNEKKREIFMFRFDKHD
jgi:hypothetical protein